MEWSSIIAPGVYDYNAAPLDGLADEDGWPAYAMTWTAEEMGRIVRRMVSLRVGS